MKKESIKTHLGAYSIFKKRATTINHAFASAIAPNDSYKEKLVDEAIKILGQNPFSDLICVYCGKPAETWDHVYGLVKNFQYYGYGHVMGNLLPCCKNCNSEKGNKNWKDFLNKKIHDTKIRNERIATLEKYFKKYLPILCGYNEIKKICPVEMRRYENIKGQVIKYIKTADKIADSIRKKIKVHEK